MSDWTFLITAGGVMIFLGFLLVAAGFFRSMMTEKGTGEDHGEKSIKGGGVIFIGPIPIVSGSDKKYAVIIMVLAIIIMLLALAFR